MDIQFRSRQQIDDTFWNACVAASTNQLVYGYSWYLDAVTSASGWSWAGLVVIGEDGGYRAVMPVPLRRKWGQNVVHQPLFCQTLGIFSLYETEPLPFFVAMQQRFRYGSVLHCQRVPEMPSCELQTRLLHTHLLDLGPDYEAIRQQYSADRKLNLRRAKACHWHIADSADPEPLIRLFQENHAAGIPNGVAPWAYVVFRNLFAELQKRGLATLRYARQDDVIHAGALFVQTNNRIIYLFNAASPIGRRGNARTLLIDQIIQEHAGRRYVGRRYVGRRYVGRRYADQPFVLDFESPEKPSVTQFYESFGAIAEPFQEVKYNRLTWVERKLQSYLNAFTS